MSFETRMSNEQIASTVEGGGQYIDKSGVYFGEIVLAEYRKTPNGAGFVTVSLKTDDGKDLNFADFCVQKNDGSDSFGMAFYHAMCNFTNIQPSAPVQSQKTGKLGFPYLYGKKIGLGVQVEWKDELNDKGYQKSNKNVVSVFDYASKKSARELALNLPATKYAEAIVDKGARLERKPQSQQNFGNPVDDFYGASQGSGHLPPLPLDDDMPF